MKKKESKETIPLFDNPQGENQTVFLDDLDESDNHNKKITLSFLDDMIQDGEQEKSLLEQNKHILKEILGEGGMGRVYVAEEPLLRREVAIKTMLRKTTPKSAYWKRFMREAQITAQLSHPSIVPVYGLHFDENHQPCLVMKKIEGKTLEEYIAYCKDNSDHEDFGIKDRIDIMLHICSAISYAHSYGVIHRDLKPENIMVGSFDEILVMDWGTARILNEEEIDTKDILISDVSVHTVYGALIGTPLYMSPEQASGENDQIGPAADTFALGMMLFEMMEFVPGRQGKSLAKILQNSISATPLKYSQKTPPVLRSIINKATQKNIEDRYSSVDEFAHDLRRYNHGEEVLVHPENVFRRLWRWVFRHPLVFLSGFLGLLLMSLVLVIYSLQDNLSSQKNLQVQQKRTAELIDMVSTKERRIDHILSHTRMQLNALTNIVLLKYGQSMSGDCILPKEVESRPGAKKMDRYASLFVSLEESSCIPAASNLGPNIDQEYDLGLLLQEDFFAMRQSLKDNNKTREMIHWLYIGTEQGLLINYPAISFFPEDYDPRKRPWYISGKEFDEPTCGNPYPDASGSGYLLPCNQAIKTKEGKLIGVSGIDMSLDEVINIMQGQKGYMLNENFEIMLQSSDQGQKISPEDAMKDNQEKTRNLFQDQVLLEELRRGKSNGVIFYTNKNYSYVYAKLQFAPWTLVLEIPDDYNIEN